MKENTKEVPLEPTFKTLVDKAVDVLQRHAPPDGLSDHDALTELYGIFDGPEYRAVIAAAPSTKEVPVEQESVHLTSTRRESTQVPGDVDGAACQVFSSNRQEESPLCVRCGRHYSHHHDDSSDGMPEGVWEWVLHMDLHLTEHDERHAGLALRAAWPHVRLHLKALQATNGELSRARRAEPTPTLRLLRSTVRALCEDGHLFEESHFKRLPTYLQNRIKLVWAAAKLETLPDAPATPSVPSRTDSKHSQSSEQKRCSCMSPTYLHDVACPLYERPQEQEQHYDDGKGGIKPWYDRDRTVDKAGNDVPLQEQEQQQTGEREAKQEWFEKGRNSVLRKNESGCCCKIDEDGETILSPCDAHKAWAESSLRAAQQQRDEILEEAAKECEKPMPECCGQFHQASFDHPPECCGNYEPRPQDAAECAASVRQLKSAQQK